MLSPVRQLFEWPNMCGCSNSKKMNGIAYAHLYTNTLYAIYTLVNALQREHHEMQRRLSLVQ